MNEAPGEIDEPLGFSAEVDLSPDAALVMLRGELDLAGSDELRRALDAALATARPLVVVSVRELRFIDSSGVSALIASRNLVLDRGRRFELRGVHGPIARVLELTGAAASLSA